jgi:hypothetical protein
MRCRACLNAHQARRKISQESCNLPALQLSPHDDTATGIDDVAFAGLANIQSLNDSSIC